MSEQSKAPDGAPCRATLQGWPVEVIDSCSREAGHYDESVPPTFGEDGYATDPGGWHITADTKPTVWSDQASGATPHSAGLVRPDEEPAVRVTLDNSTATYTPTDPPRPYYPDEEQA